MLDQDTLKKFLSYDPDTGLFTWVARGRGIPTGEIAGKRHTGGYTSISIQERGYYAHRLAFLYMTGAWPSKSDVDHINGVRNDNRWANLREASVAENRRNSRGHADSAVAFKGVTRKMDKRGKRPRYSAEIMVNRRTHYLGRFDTPEEAHAAYSEAASRLHGEFARS